MHTCAHCKTPTGGSAHWQARNTILWANQYGLLIRVFCDDCGVLLRWRYVGEHKPEGEHNGWREEHGIQG